MRNWIIGCWLAMCVVPVIGGTVAVVLERHEAGHNLLGTAAGLFILGGVGLFMERALDDL